MVTLRRCERRGCPTKRSLMASTSALEKPASSRPKLTSSLPPSGALLRLLQTTQSVPNRWLEQNSSVLPVCRTLLSVKRWASTNLRFAHFLILELKNVMLSLLEPPTCLSANLKSMSTSILVLGLRIISVLRTTSFPRLWPCCRKRAMRFITSR